MIATVILCATLSAAAASTELPNLGVIGGLLASPGQFPFQISIEFNGRHICGGTIIGPKHILTAAHCVHEMEKANMTVLAGTNKRHVGGKRVGIQDYTVHENYAPPSAAYDIAIITLDKELKLGGSMKAAELPEQGEILYDNAVATISGWGAQFHNGPINIILKYVAIPLWSRERCIQSVPDLPTTHLCAGDMVGFRNSCPGDSGGPLSIGHKVIGVVSYGFGCGNIFRPAMYVYVAGLRDWIREHSGI